MPGGHAWSADGTAWSNITLGASCFGSLVLRSGSLVLRSAVHVRGLRRSSSSVRSAPAALAPGGELALNLHATKLKLELPRAQ